MSTGNYTVTNIIFFLSAKPIFAAVKSPINVNKYAK